MIAAGERVLTPEGWPGRVRFVRRQEPPHGGPRIPGGGIGAKRARLGELEAAYAGLKTYACVDLDRGGFANYEVGVLREER
jgi:hypothetical protein